MPPERILPAQFMHVSAEIRKYLADMWKLPRSGISEVRDQEVISDGHTYDDLATITHEKMTEYIGSVETFARAWEITVAKAFSELHPPVGIIQKKAEIEPAPAPVVNPEVTPESEIQATTETVPEPENVAGAFVVPEHKPKRK